jgi:hypothetical protein
VGLFDQVIRINITPRQNLIIAALHMTVAQSAFVKKPFDIYWPPILVTMQPDTGGESLKQIILIGIPESIVVLIIVIVFGGAGWGGGLSGIEMGSQSEGKFCSPQEGRSAETLLIVAINIHTANIKLLKIRLLFIISFSSYFHFSTASILFSVLRIRSVNFFT